MAVRQAEIPKAAAAEAKVRKVLSVAVMICLLTVFHADGHWFKLV